MTRSERLPEHRAGPTPLDEIFQAIDDEIAAARADPSHSIDVVEGRRLHRGIGGSLYSFRAEATIQLQPETPIELIRDGQQTRGALVTVDDFDVVVHLRDDLGETIASGRLSTSPAFVLERLRERLESVTLRPQLPSGGIAGATWQPEAARVGFDEAAAIEGSKALTELDDLGLHPNESQWRAMAKAAGSDLHFVWGPPGTGKTAALAQTARMLADRGERVLVLAHANVAVDVAMVRAADAFAGTPLLAGSGVLRVGEPHHPDARERGSILVEAAVERRAPWLAQERRELEDRRREITSALRRASGRDSDELAAELRQARARLKELLQEYRNESSLAIEQARVIGATLSRFVLSDDVWEWRPDAILLDEASMVSFPWVLLAATGAASRLVVYGDFRQLPPVYVARTEAAHRWLRSDAFEVAGVRARIDDGEDDPRVTLLDTQYRMAPSIGGMISDFAYGGRLRTDPRAGESAALLSAGDPFPDRSLVVVDTSTLRSGCDTERKPGSFSRVNPLHIALGLSLAAAAEHAALVNPYRAQARLYAAGARDVAHSVTAATIHRYQGSEQDCVVFDAVEALPMTAASRLTGGDVDLALRLTNVALSRARGKAIVLADMSFLEDRFAPESPLRRAVRLCVARGVVVDASETLLDGPVRWADGSSASDLLTSELAVAQSEVLLNFPRELVPDDSLLAAVERAARGVAYGLFAGGPRLVRPLEGLPSELRLLTASCPVLLVDRHVAVVGSRDLSVAARIESRGLVAALKASIFGAEDRSAGRTLEAGGSRPALPRG